MNIQNLLAEYPEDKARIAELIEDGVTQDQLNSYLDQGIIKIDCHGVVSLIEPIYSNETMLTFKNTNDDGHTTIFHGLIRVGAESGVSHFFINDEEEFKAIQENGGRIELVGSIGINNSDDIINCLEMNPYEPVNTVYDRVQNYGGSEEGGWYYHTMHAGLIISSEEAKVFKSEYNQYGEGQSVVQEFFYGQHENTAKQHYC